MLKRNGKSLVLFLVLLLGGSSLHAKDLVIDLSAPIVQITAAFSGTELLLFGAKRGDGDVIVVVRGPLENQTVHLKERKFGIWVNTENLKFNDLPSYYWVASNRPVFDVLPADTLTRLQIGLDEITIQPTDKNANSAEAIAFRAALIRDKVRKKLYSEDVSPLLFLNDMLFRTKINFPANVSVGEFAIETYLVRDQEVITSETTLLHVRKFGLEAEIYDFAHNQSLLYGIFAVIIACVAGWLANAAFRRS
ncbi:TIGR02186 family protein [Thalassospiraceae bacterium LMO-JJ14]|nr:TIGR02186 family protein [Thalassospiraceae bacterium LMO-JJ14]